MKQHWAIFIDNDSNKTKILKELLQGQLEGQLSFLNNLQGTLFSKLTLSHFLEEEDRHGAKIITKDTNQSLSTLSSGEQKKALLAYILLGNPNYIVLDNPFDNLDIASQSSLIHTLEIRSKQTIFIQIISRKTDLLPFITNFAQLTKNDLHFYSNLEAIFPFENTSHFQGSIPSPLTTVTYEADILVQLKDVTIRYGDKTILQNINWKISKGEFWQLMGQNGSGKTTLLSMITGENPKGYGQDLHLFGRKKGSGESIWDIKKNIGYFTPAMTHKFTGYHSIENMLISGLNDSIGLYIKPTEAQLRLTKQWLVLLNLWHIKDSLFHDLSMGQKRLVMTTRAMIKHPLLLILDEPTAGLDDTSVKLLVALVNKISKESNTTILFVSHRKEPGLSPHSIYELVMTHQGSRGSIV